MVELPPSSSVSKNSSDPKKKKKFCVFLLREKRKSKLVRIQFGRCYVGSWPDSQWDTEVKIRFTPSARKQFLNIVQYIQKDNPGTAFEFRIKAEKMLAQLRRYPNSGRKIPEFPDLSYREIIIPPYRYFYRLEGNHVWSVAWCVITRSTLKWGQPHDIDVRWWLSISSQRGDFSYSGTSVREPTNRRDQTPSLDQGTRMGSELHYWFRWKIPIFQNDQIFLSCNMLITNVFFLQVKLFFNFMGFFSGIHYRGMPCPLRGSHY